MIIDKLIEGSLSLESAINLMISESGINWVLPHDREHDEASFQAQHLKDSPEHLKNQLNHLSDLDNFRSAIKNGSTEIYDKKRFWKSRVGNTEASAKRVSTIRTAAKTLVSAKLSRASSKLRSAVKGNGSVEMPIILRHKESGHEHLLAGNTRATLAASKGMNIKARVIEY